MLMTAYIGASNVAHKVKKMYVGDSTGKARCMYNPIKSSDEIFQKINDVSSLSESGYEKAGASNDNYAIFAGGRYSNSYYNTTDAYSKSLVRTSPNNIGTSIAAMSGLSTNDYAVFAGGYYYAGATHYFYDWVVYYDTSLIRSTANNSLSNRRSLITSAMIGNYMLFVGGSTYQNNKFMECNNVDAYNKSFIKQSIDYLPEGTDSMGSTSIGNYALFAGGYKSTKTVYTYSSSLVRSTAPDLPIYVSGISATSIGNYALFAGPSYATSNTIYLYNKSLVYSTSPTSLTYNRYDMAAITKGNYAFFAGGQYTRNNTTYICDNVDLFDESLTKSTANTLANSKYNVIPLSVGNYALFAGGNNGSYLYSDVDAYLIISEGYN